MHHCCAAAARVRLPALKLPLQSGLIRRQSSALLLQLQHPRSSKSTVRPRRSSLSRHPAAAADSSSSRLSHTMAAVAEVPLADTNGSSGTNGHVANGHANGNGHTNGHAFKNGHTNGAAKGTANGHKTPARESRVFSLDNVPPLAEFEALCSQTLMRDDCPLASDIVDNVPIYDLPSYAQSTEASREGLQDEWYHTLLNGAGIVVLRNFLPDPALIERVNAVYDAIIASEAGSTSKGDHFAAAGKNSRVWNSFQKHALRDPASFADYYANPWLALVCEAWLGAAYRVTAQLNIVRPGGQPQVAHRDYHLGFQSAAACARFPRAMQVASQLLTLQGGIAHSDVPLASGPTRVLPFSQAFPAGYMAYRRPEFVELFDRRWVSVGLARGDAVFFNPALFHAAGENRTPDVHRSVNLLQISSAFGRAMETVDTLAVVERVWDAVRRRYRDAGEDLDAPDVQALVKAVADAYPFPTNLDRRPPAPGGMAPESEVDLLFRGLREGLSTEQITQAVRQLQADSQA